MCQGQIEKHDDEILSNVVTDKNNRCTCAVGVINENIN